MRNSDRTLILSIIFFVLGMLTIIPIYVKFKSIFYIAIFPSVFFLFAGYNYAASRGWADIELRRSNPEFFEDENVNDD